MSSWDSTWTFPSFRRLDWRIQGAQKEKDYTFYLLAGEGLERGQRVWSRLCGKEQSAEHDWFRATPNSTAQHHCRPSHPCQRVDPYAPTMSATSDTKDEFYENLAAIISSVPNNEQLVLLGDFNAFNARPSTAWHQARPQAMMGFPWLDQTP